MKFPMFYMYMYLVHHALSKHIEFNKKKKTMVMYIFSASSKGKGVYFKRRNPYITACSLNVGHTKKLK